MQVPGAAGLEGEGEEELPPYFSPISSDASTPHKPTLTIDDDIEANLPGNGSHGNSPAASDDDLADLCPLFSPADEPSFAAESQRDQPLPLFLSLCLVIKDEQNEKTSRVSIKSTRLPLCLSEDDVCAALSSVV